MPERTRLSLGFRSCFQHSSFRFVIILAISM